MFENRARRLISAAASVLARQSPIFGPKSCWTSRLLAVKLPAVQFKKVTIMKFIKTLAATACATIILAGMALAAEQKQTCCEKAAAEGKTCTMKCCVAAHHEGKSCEKCNPNKEDLKLIKKGNQAGQKKED